MPACTTCGDEGALLFACQRCDREFCADHGLPYHDCENFSEIPLGAGGDERETDGEAPVDAGGTARPTPGAEPFVREASGERRAGRAEATLRPDGGVSKERRDDRSMIEWMREQSYADYLTTVTSLSLLFTFAFYGGLVAPTFAETLIFT